MIGPLRHKGINLVLGSIPTHNANVLTVNIKDLTMRMDRWKKCFVNGGFNRNRWRFGWNPLRFNGLTEIPGHIKSSHDLTAY